MASGTPIRTPMALVALAALIAFALLAAMLADSTVHFSARSGQPSRLQLFHADAKRFAEARSRWLELGPDQRAFSIKLRGADAAWLRLDPGSESVTTLCALGLGRDARPTEFELQPAMGMSLQRTGNCLQLRPETGATDPQFALRFTGATQRQLQIAARWHLVAKLVAVLAALLAAALSWRLRGSAHRLLERIPVNAPGEWVLRHLHWICAALILAFGIAYALLTPPGAVPDEEAHLAKVVRVANGVWLGDSGTQPFPDVHSMYGVFTDYGTYKQPFARAQVAQQAARPLTCIGGNTALPGSANSYFGHQYLAPSVAFQVACATHASFGAFLYSSRLLNLLLAVALCAWGIRWAAHGRLALAAVALLPMSVFQLASISADSLHIALGVAWLGLVSGIAGGVVPVKRATLPLALLSLAIALLKPGSGWILSGLLFCGPAYRRAGSSFVKVLVLFMILPMLVHVLLIALASGSAVAMPGVDPQANLQLLSAEPLDVWDIVLSTFVDKGGELATQAVGLLGWLDVPLSPWAYPLAAALLFSSLAADPPLPLSPGLPVRALSLVFAAGAALLIALPLFVVSTPAASPVVQGLQGRYFLPMAAWVAVWLSITSPAGARQWIALLVVIGVVVLNVDALHQLDQAYFVVGR